MLKREIMWQNMAKAEQRKGFFNFTAVKQNGLKR
jgi:hypothetical protein